MTTFTLFIFSLVLILAAICIRNVRLMKAEVLKYKEELDARFTSRQKMMDDTVNEYKTFLDKSRAEFLGLTAK